MQRFTAVARYRDPGVSKMAHAIKRGNPSAIMQAAYLMAEHVTCNCVLVPVACHCGYPTYTMHLANQIAVLTGCKVLPCIRGKKRKSLYEIKKNGLPIPSPDEYFSFVLTERVPEGRPVILIDNVTATRTTANTCLKLIPNASVLTYADDETARKNKL